MKMSDVFNGEVSARHIDEDALLALSQGCYSMDDWHLKDDSYWLASKREHVKAAAHAINCHDELVDALTKAMAFIDSHVADPDITDEMSTNWMQLESANPWQILSKARNEK